MAALVAVATVVIGQATPAFAAAITVTATAPAGVLVGEPIRFELSAANPAGGTAAPEYNLTFRDALPLGVTYVAGSTSPATAGEPDIRTAADGRQVLIWSNVGDLPVGARVGLSFSAQPDATSYPVGSTVSNLADAYSSTDPRTLAKFNAQGIYTAGSATEVASSNATSTTISAIDITKSEPSPEHELLRGVHDHSTVYTLRTRNNTRFATSGVQVVDLLPAQLEFLGCGTVDNSSSREYVGAPALSVVPDLTTDCPAPTSVTTVVNPAGVPAGTYTRVVWDLGTLAANQEKLVRYRAGIPLRANVAFAGGPTGASLGQAANLDNNTGASTRETATEQALTNLATATGTYTGPVKANGSTTVTDTDQLTVTAEDLALQKSVSTGSFAGNGTATWTLRVSTGEYATASSVVLTDVLPDGLCPLSSTTNFSLDGGADCAPVPGSDPTGAAYDSVDARADGTYAIVFTPIDLAASDVATVTFGSRMRASYADTGMDPTVSGDGFTNTVSLTGTTTPVAATGFSGAQPVKDDSAASLASDAPAIDKRVLPERAGVSPYACDPDPAAYRDDLAATDTRLTFDEGDRVCFLVRVDFSDVNSTRNPVVTDFLPPGLSYEAGSATPTPANTVAADLSAVGNVLTWQVGAARSGGRYVDAGAVFEYILSGTVTDPAVGPQPDVTGNLAKLRYESTDGSVFALRDRVDLSFAAAPPIGVAKTASRVSGTTPVPQALADNAAVRGGDTVEYTVTATNNGGAATRNAVDVVGPDVWDVLPAGIVCADVSAVSDAGECRNPSDAGYPVPRSGLQTRSVVRWDLPDSVVVAPGASRALTFQVLYRPETSVSTTYTNTAAVSTYRSPSNQGVLVDHAPRTNIARDVTVTDAAPAEGTHRLATPNASVAKTLTSPSDGPNNGTNQATAGETVRYTYRVDVPRGTTVYAGRLGDALPAGVTLVAGSPSWTYYPDAASAAVDVQPSGFALASDGTLTFPSTWTNATATDQRFAVTLDVLVADGTHSATRTNTARFDSTLGAGGSAITARTATASFTLVVPQPTLTKTDDDADDVVVVGQEITYTLVAGNAAGRPPLHDAFVVDCLPDGLSLVAGSTSTAPRDVTAGTGSNGCPAGATRIEWSVGDLAGGGSTSLTYRARVSDSAGGSQRYTNAAELSGSTMDDDKVARADADRSTERSFAVPAATTVTVQPAGVDKTVARSRYTVGERARWSVAVDLPAQVNFYDAALVDQLPAGIDASTLELVDVTCTQGGSTCTLPGTPTMLAGSVAGDGSTSVGWGLGDVLASSAPRVVTLTYTAVVADVSRNTAGDVLLNSATLKWDQTDGAAPTRADETFGASATPDTASFTVVEPSLSLAKAVDDATPAPRQDFRYTVTLTNAPAGSNASAAHDVQVSDVVPAGVVVDPATISAGGSLTGADPARGGGTIAWTVPGPVAAGTSVALTYDAVLASPAAPGALVNTADITGYRSLSGGGRTYDGPTATRSVRAALPHVTIDKTAVGSGTAYIGEPQQWRLAITSTGDSTAYGVDATDRLPQGWTYDSGTARVSVAGAPAVAVAPLVTTAPGGAQTLDWTELGDLPVGATVVVTYSATPGASVVTAPGVGASVAHTNTAGTTAEDEEGEQSDATGASYAGPDDTASVHVDSADLRVTKTHAGTAVAGRPLAWTVRVTNDGPDAAVGPWTVTDTLPTALASAPVTATGTGWSCGRVARTITCTRPAGSPLAASASLPDIAVTATLPADVVEGTTLTNVAGVEGRTHDPRPANDTATDDVTVTTSADLGIDKAVSGPVVAGRDATWTIVVDNRGPSIARAPFTVTDTLPAGVSFRRATGTGWSCAAPVGSQLVCTYGADVAVGASAPTLTVVAGIPSSQVAAVDNAVAITDTTTDDPEPANDTDAVSTAPDAEADLGLAKTRLGEVVAGQDATYELAVHNAGDSDARGVGVTDDLPAGLTYVGSTSVAGSWTCAVAAGRVSCDLAGTLAAGATATVEVRVAVASSVTGSVVNAATVHSTTRDPNPANDTDDDDSSTDVRADLAIAKDHAGRVLAGGRVTYALRVTNEGPSDSAGPIVATDVLPDGMTLVSATGAGWTCGPAAGVSVSCSRPGPLADGAAAPVITVVADVAADAGPATLVNRATVDGPADPNVLNDTASDPTVVEDEADVAITKTATDPTPVAGTTTAFELVVSNAGPSDADDVRVVDDMPAGLTAVAASGDGWACTVTDGSLTCERPTLAAGASAPVITVRAAIGSALPAGTDIVNEARVSTSTDGDLPGDDTDDAALSLRTATDLSVTKTHTGRAVPGTSMRFTLVVGNGGPSDVAGQVSLVDTLPDGMTYVSASGVGWSCDAVGDRVTCLHDGPLAAGEQLPPVELTVQLAPDATGDLVNRAAVEPRADDTDAADDTTTDTVTLEPEVDLSLVKTHTGPVRVGEELAFTLTVRNAGPSTATGVAVRDLLPEGLVPVSAAGRGWTCAAAAVTCTLDAPLAPGGAAAPLTVRATVRPAAYPMVTNVATVSSDGTETAPQDNTGRDGVEVPALSDLTLDKSHQGDVVVGQTVRYSLRVTNAGPTADPGPLTVTDVLPTGLSFVSGSGEGWTCVGGAAVVCTREGALAAGASVDLVVEAAVGPDAYPSVRNVASVDSPAEETDLTNNQDDDVAPVVPVSALSLDKEVRSQSASGRVVYDIEVTNDGPSPSTDPVRVVDDLPAQLELVEASGTGWECTTQRDVATCTHAAPIAVGDTAAFVVTTQVRESARPGQQVVNTAVLDGPDGSADVSDQAVVEVLDEQAVGDDDGQDAGGNAGGGGNGDDVKGEDAGGPTAGLPDTGGPAWWLGALAALLVLTGAGLVTAARRRA
ncbi:hypothetical protein [Nocardioides zeicaulis]|uniref:DUF11 domain-containing protein n=1 Tax=Nocardioides zeicaulis TaxID=1776857 RepID=A0ABV6DXU7_9ACTN